MKAWNYERFNAAENLKQFLNQKEIKPEYCTIIYNKDHYVLFYYK